MTQRTELTAAQKRILNSANRTEDGHFFVPWPQLRPPGADEKACVNMVSDGLMERGTGFNPSYQITAAGRAALQED
jgi:hypothetical protein